MKADERIIEARARLEAVETLLKDQRIGPELREEIRGHFHVSQSSTAIDQASLFRSVVTLESRLASSWFGHYNLLGRPCGLVLKLFKELIGWFCSLMSHSLKVEVASCTARYIPVPTRVLDVEPPLGYQ